MPLFDEHASRISIETTSAWVQPQMAQSSSFTLLYSYSGNTSQLSAWYGLAAVASSACGAAEKSRRPDDATLYGRAHSPERQSRHSSFFEHRCPLTSSRQRRPSPPQHTYAHDDVSWHAVAAGFDRASCHSRHRHGHVWDWGQGRRRTRFVL